MEKYNLQPLDQADIDEIVATVASEILDNADYHMAQWRNTRSLNRNHQVNTGLAQAGDLGVDILSYIASLSTDAWQFISGWIASNQDNLVSGLISSVLYDYLKRKMERSQPETRNVLAPEERETVNQSLGMKILEKIDKQKK